MPRSIEFQENKLNNNFAVKDKTIVRSVSITTLLLALLGSPVFAESLYRCGSAYQDHPCATGQSNKVMGTGGGAQSSVKSSADANCVQRGVDAQKIVWGREGGASAEQLADKARSDSERKLIGDVYRQRGTSTEIRARIEADCVAEKERAARLRALLEAANLSPSAASPPSARQPETDSRSDATARTVANSSANADRKNSECESLRRQNQSIVDRQRTGGNMATMESLNRQKTESDADLRQAGC
jgi:hypothetical protein